VYLAIVFKGRQRGRSWGVLRIGGSRKAWQMRWDLDRDLRQEVIKVTVSKEKGRGEAGTGT
jgi:hypothetical protein